MVNVVILMWGSWQCVSRYSSKIVIVLQVVVLSFMRNEIFRISQLKVANASHVEFSSYRASLQNILTCHRRFPAGSAGLVNCSPGTAVSQWIHIKYKSMVSVSKIRQVLSKTIYLVFWVGKEKSYWLGQPPAVYRIGVLNWNIDTRYTWLGLDAVEQLTEIREAWSIYLWLHVVIHTYYRFS